MARSAESLTEVAATGDRLGTLLALRNELAKRIDNPAMTEPVASLARQLRDTLKEIEELSVSDDDDPLAKLRGKKEARRKAPARKAPAKKAATRKQSPRRKPAA